MPLPESTNLTDFRAHLAAHLRRLQTSPRPIMVTQRGRVRGVVMSPKQYEELAEAMALQQLMQSLDEGDRSVDAIEFLSGLKRRYETMSSRLSRPAKTSARKKSRRS
jgi:prevent-host-death family protein